MTARAEAGSAESRPTGIADDFVASVEPLLPAMKALAVRLAGIAAAEDVVQDAIELAWRQRNRFDASRGSLRAWLLMLVADRVRRQLRRRRFIVVPLHEDQLPAAPQGGDHDLHAALRKLTARQRTAVALYYYLDLPLTEVADVLKCSTGTAKSTLSDARRRLSELLAVSPGSVDDD